MKNETREKGKGILNFLDRIPYIPLTLITLFMLLAPFRPMPHAVEKISMLLDGRLTRPIDIFDLFYHLTPSALLALKIIRDVGHRSRN